MIWIHRIRNSPCSLSYYTKPSKAYYLCIALWHNGVRTTPYSTIVQYYMSKQESDEYRDLVICNYCSWMASLLRGSSGFEICPTCGRRNLDIIPVGDHERYIVHIKDKRGIEIEFSK
jgi:hypothetical protein